jgi:hypothetical protein
MITEKWIELKRNDFLTVIQSIKPTVRIKSAPARELQIGLVDGKLVFSVEGASASAPATGHWPGLASLRLAYFLTFLVAKPTERLVRIAFADEKVSVSSARFPAQWRDTNALPVGEQLLQHAASPPKEKILRFKCPKCRRVRGVGLYTISAGPFVADAVKDMVLAGESLGHGFGCLNCGRTWEYQAV